jgi:hypothetical protein
MNASFLTFFLFAASMALLRWKPASKATTGLRMVSWFALGFLAIVALLASLFTVWWPPAQTWAVIWSAGAVAVLAMVAVSGSSPTDWLN